MARTTTSFRPPDPRARLSPSRREAVLEPAGPAEYLAFEPRASEHLMRGQNFVLHHVVITPGTVLRRTAQPDEYVLLVPDAGTRVTVSTGGQRAVVSRPSIVIVPPGDSEITAETPGRLIRLLTTVSAPGLAGASANAGRYATPKPNAGPYRAWPGPGGGHAIRVYDLDVPDEPGRFGRIWRCSTFMVNFLAPGEGPRDPHRLSPHAHDDFEQCSLALAGDFVHHLRWPWGADRIRWRDDVHLAAPSPSAVVIPPPVIHTTEATGAGPHQLVDIFCPPRRDFSQVAGWVLNAGDYPMPDGAGLSSASVPSGHTISDQGGNFLRQVKLP